MSKRFFQMMIDHAEQELGVLKHLNSKALPEVLYEAVESLTGVGVSFLMAPTREKLDEYLSLLIAVAMAINANIEASGNADKILESLTKTDQDPKPMEGEPNEPVEVGAESN